MVEEATPTSPEDFVTVKFGDLTDLQNRLAASQESLRAASSDIAWILVTLGIKIPDDAEVSPELAVSAYIIPKIQGLMATQGLVNGAEQELRQRAKALQLPEIQLGGGRTGVLAGKRLPSEFLKPTSGNG